MHVFVKERRRNAVRNTRKMVSTVVLVPKNN
jgi:hypothetical protein